MADKKILFLDLETSGLYPDSGHTILSIGAVLDRKTKKDPIREFYMEVLPTPGQWALANPRALEVNGFTWEHLSQHGQPLPVVTNEFVGWLMDNGVVSGKAIIVGHKPSFDMGFLKSTMQTELDFINFPVSRDEVLDIRELYDILVNRRVMPFLSKSSGGRSAAAMANALGVPGEPAIHNALEGARLARRNYEKIMSLLQPAEL